MWRCAQLLPDNDELTAEALYRGGTFLMNRDPKAADRFYKALVRRCGKLPLSRQADALHWFPPQHPRPAVSGITEQPLEGQVPSMKSLRNGPAAVASVTSHFRIHTSYFPPPSRGASCSASGGSYGRLRSAGADRAHKPL